MKSDGPGPISGRSLRGGLLARLIPALVVIFAIGVFAANRIATSTADLAFDRGTSDDVRTLAARVQTAPDGTVTLDLPAAAAAVLRSDVEDDEFFSVFAPDGRLLAGDADLLPAEASVGQPMVVARQFRGRTIHQASLRMETSAGPVMVSFAETSRKRERARREILIASILPNALLLLVTVAAVFFGVGHGLAPLDALGRTIRARPVEDLSQMPLERIPVEARPLVAAMNRLLAGLAASSAAQRAFIADAAHQLRTPLTAMATQMELLSDDLPPAERARTTHLRDSIQRLAHLAHQLLALARSGPDANIDRPLEAIDLAEIAEAIASEWYDRAAAKSIEITFDLEPAPVSGHRWLLLELLTNLVDNAVRYTPEGGHVAIATQRRADRADLVVTDDGPGVPETERAAIFERFFRGRDVRESGTGLGLAIVGEIAQLHGATVEVGTSGEGGAAFRVRFPAADGPTAAAKA